VNSPVDAVPLRSLVRVFLKVSINEGGHTLLKGHYM
jgi:hypothetical protein